MSTTTANLGLFKYNTTTDANLAFSIETALNGNWDKIDAAVGNSSSRNIGEIVASTIPLTDAGLHLLDGTLISGSGSYSAFVDYIAGLYNSGDYTAIFDTEANWQTSVTTYGVCGKFVYDSVNNTVRLPKYNSKIYTGGGTAPVLGNGMSLGMTDGTNNFTIYNNGSCVTSLNAPAYGSNIGSSISGNVVATTFKSIGVTNNSSKSGLVADLSNITTALDGYYYIVVATSTKTDIQVDIDEIATDLNGKADVDLSNTKVAQTFKTNAMQWSIPDYSNGVTFSGTILLPCNALISATITGNGASWVYAEFAINGVLFGNSSAYGSSAIGYGEAGSTVVVNSGQCTYYPLKGVN